MRIRVFGFIMTFLLVLVLAASASARMTRDLVFDDDEDDAVASAPSNIQNPTSVAIRTTMELTRNGETSTVLPTHSFKSGDKVKLRYTLNADGYVYWLAKMSSGTYAVLFPTEKTGMDNYVKRNQEQTVPVKGSFRFDDKKGTETLLIVYSAERIPELDQAVAEANGNKGQVGSKAKNVASIEDENTSKRRSRDLVFDDEDDEDVNTKTQVAPKGEPLVAVFELVHN